MSRDIVLFVNAIRPATFHALKQYEAQTGRQFTPVVFVDKSIKQSVQARNGQHHLPDHVTVLEADFDSPGSIRRALRPFAERVFAVTTQYENCLLELKKLIPYFPYLPMPTESSVDWGGEKKLMREQLAAYDPSLVPGYLEVANYSEDTLERLEQALHYPMIVKPSGLEGSLLVARANTRDELRVNIAKTFRAIQASYDEWVKRQKPAVLVEEFMEGKKYVLDSYVAADGSCRHAPLITSVRGIEAGFDDFFEYSASLPPALDEATVRGAQRAAERAVHALGFRSLTADIELMHTKRCWKIIELTARMGGYCHDMYAEAYGISHIMNDIVNRAGEAPRMPTSLLNYTAVFDVYARREGVLSQVRGLDAVRRLPSFKSLTQHIQPGQPVAFAKHGGDSVFYFVFSHPNRAQLRRDTAAMERSLGLRVTQNAPRPLANLTA
jgi:hypothetical protein